MEWITTIVGAILGAILSHSPALIEWYRQSLRKDLFGNWISSWEPLNDGKDYWTRETVIVKSRVGRIQLINCDNVDGYRWHGNGKIIKKQYFQGEWNSLKDGAHSGGTFSLVVVPQGDAMHGFFAGPNDHGEIKRGHWILARDEDALARVRMSIRRRYETPNKGLVRTGDPRTARQSAQP